jgi:putative resolvase
MPYVPLRKVVEVLGLHPNTLRKYADEGNIQSIKNEAGQRLFDVTSVRCKNIGEGLVLSIR